MAFYPYLKIFHIIFTGIWFSNILLHFFIKLKSGNEQNNKFNLSLFLKLLNLFGIIGSVGILVTGIILTLLNSSFSFFQFTSNHWLATKQIVMVIILILLFTAFIPSAKLLRKELEKDIYPNESTVKKFLRLSSIINFLVILNLLFAFSRYFIGS